MKGNEEVYSRAPDKHYISLRAGMKHCLKGSMFKLRTQSAIDGVILRGSGKFRRQSQLRN